MCALCDLIAKWKYIYSHTKDLSSIQNWCETNYLSVHNPLSKSQAQQKSFHVILSSLFVTFISFLLCSLLFLLSIAFISFLFLVLSVCALPSFLLARHIVSADCTNLIVYRSKVNEDHRAWREMVYWYAFVFGIGMRFSLAHMDYFPCVMCVYVFDRQMRWSALASVICLLWSHAHTHQPTDRTNDQSTTLRETHGAVIVVMRSQRMCNLVEISTDSHH